MCKTSGLDGQSSKYRTRGLFSQLLSRVTRECIACHTPLPSTTCLTGWKSFALICYTSLSQLQSPVCILGSHSTMEHHQSVHFSHERQMSAGSHRLCGPHRVWGGIFLRTGTEQAYGKQGKELWTFSRGSVSSCPSPLTLCQRVHSFLWEYCLYS